MNGDLVDTDLARTWVQAIAAAVDQHKDHLTQLDSAIGDADHGTNMHRGFSAAVTALADYEPDTVGAVLVKAGTTLVSTVGGASGPLYGGAFRAIGKALDTPTADAGRIADALAAGLASIEKLGAAAPGDKTMIDAYAPALAAFRQRADAGDDAATAAAAAAEAAEEGMRATTPMQARKGRASYLGARSVGHQDPGATSTALVFRALADTLAGRAGTGEAR
ncbi:MULTISPECIES: dihydroxyacetone kinase subunit DhaL [unclassified Streptomyces]|uniref:dihydroxyacetone kinase subunit DhaL n=1 Tax=unclassified Streptomyces TaxID=2593676 RepID=UPI000F6D669A|nr:MULTISPECIES: dihydroxyacetone kinase subunit DhaL [unclassified Streptomyces]AZM61111.1 dihydroxyacetone kinase subunit L [Streptomyces sp. WAC 01438]RSM90365.1 dihydroxyacetone kinase subunit L [Streptomyces sp. WAC 01420]